MIAASSLLGRVREQKPVIHHLTNWVTVYDCSEVVKAFGASPVMAHAPEEVAEMAAIASALVLNIGTLTVDFVEAMKIAARSANTKGIPVVLDACGAGATKLRDDACRSLLADARIDIIKGNASEIARVAGMNVKTKGVDAADVTADMKALARGLARAKQCTVVVTGAQDIITDAGTAFVVANGHPLMTTVVGTGCMAASVIGTFAAVEKNYAAAAAAGLACYEIAAELAAATAAGPGSFKESLFDRIYTLDAATVDRLHKITDVA